MIYYFYLYVVVSICSEIYCKRTKGHFILHELINTVFFDNIVNRNKHEVKFSEILRSTLLFIIIGLPLYVIILPLFLIIRLPLDLIQMITVGQTKRNQENIPPDEERIGVHMPWKLNPFYHKLIFSLNNNYSELNNLGIKAIKAKHSKYDYFVLPIIHDFKLLNRVIYKNNFREDLERNKYGLYIFESNRCIDEIPNDTSIIFDDFSNINYSNFGGWHDYGKQEVCAWFLSELLSIDIDGVDKLVIWSKNNLHQLKVISLHEFSKGFSESLVEECSITIHLDKYDIHKLLSFYLCLKWKNSGLPENESLRISSRIIKKEFLDAFSTNNYLINWVDLIEFKPDEEKGILNRSIGLSENEHAKQSSLKRLETEIGISYKSRIFLKTANMAFDLIKDEDIDYSILVIGYTKFFESEVKLSILPFIRSELGVSMPDFYNTYCPGKIIILELNDNFKVDFNQQNKLTGELIPPGLGQILNSYNFLNNKIAFTKISHAEFNNITKEFNRIRNRSAHSEIVSSNDLIRVRDIIVRLYDKNVFDDLYSVKVILSSTQTASVDHQANL